MKTTTQIRKLSLFLLLFQTFLSATIQEDIQNICPQEYEAEKSYISNYLIRMEDTIRSEGCQSIPIFSELIKTERFGVMDGIEENPHLMKRLISLYSIDNKISKVVFQNSAMKNIILENSLSDKFLENFTYLVKKKVHKKELKQISKNNTYLNYLLLASLYASSPRESIKFYNQLKSSIPIDLMPSFGLILGSVGDEYEPKELLESFATIGRTLSDDAIKTLAQYPQYFILLLYPRKVDLDVGTMSGYQLRKIQKSIQKEALYIYKNMYEKYRYESGVNQVDYALLTIEYIYPYLLEQYDVEHDDFKALFHNLIEKEYILSLFAGDKCSNSAKENFAIFGQNNIKNAINLAKKEKQLVNTLVSELKYGKDALMSYFYVANLYNSLDAKEWEIFKVLLKTLPNSYQDKIALIQVVERNGYFRNIVHQNDYDVIIDSEYANINPKCTYILLTPYPSRNDNTLFDLVLSQNISDGKLKIALVDLTGKDRDELERHEFTVIERIFANVDKIDYVVTAVSIVAIPFTGGISLSYVAMKTASKYSAKRGFKYMMKKTIVKSKRLLNNGVKHVQKIERGLYKKIGATNMKYAIDKKIGVVARKKIGKVIEGTDYTVTTLSVTGVGALIFLGSQELEAKTICEEK